MTSTDWIPSALAVVRPAVKLETSRPLPLVREDLKAIEFVA